MMSPLSILARLRRWLRGNQFSTIIYHAPVLIGTIDAAGKVLSVNRDIPGLLGSNIYDHVLPEAREATRQQIEQVFRKRLSIKVEAPIKRLDGKITWMEGYISPIIIGDEVVEAGCVANAINTRKRQQQELEKRVLELQTVAEVSAQISAILEPDQLLQNVCDLIKERFNLYHAHIYLLNNAHDKLILRAGTGEASRRMLEVGRSFLMGPDEQGVVAQAARERRGVISNNVHDDPHFLYNPFLPETRSEMTIPMIVGERLVGVLDVQDKAVDRFTEADVRVMSTLAVQMGIAIQNASLYEGVRRQSEIADTLREVSFILNSKLSLDDIFDHLLIHVWWLVPYDAANFMLIDHETAIVVRCVGHHEPARPNPVGTSYDLTITRNLREVYQSRQVISISDVREYNGWIVNDVTGWIRSWVGAPIIINGKVAGVLSLDSAQTDTYSEAQHDVLLTFASSAAIAIGNARLFEAERRQREMADTLRDVSLALTSVLGQEELLERMLQEVGRVLPADAAAIWLDDGTGFFRLKATIGYEKFNIQREQLMALAFQRGESPFLVPHVFIVPHTQEEPRWVHYAGFEWIHSWSAAPITVRGEMIGQLSLDSAVPGAFREEHKPILQALATQMSIAIEKARLYEAVNREREVAEILRDIGVVLTRSLDQADVLPQILVQVGRLIPYDAASVRLDGGDGIFRLVAGIGYERFALTENQMRITFTRENNAMIRDMSVDKRPIVLPDVNHDPRWMDIPGFEWIKSWASAPIIVNGELIGSFDLNHTTVNFYTPQIEPMLAQLGTQISIAVGNARLFEAERQRRLEIEAVQRSSLTLTTSLDLNEVLSAIISAIIDLTPAQDVHVFLYDSGKLRFGGAWYEGKPQGKPFAMPRESGLTYRVAETGEMIIVPNVQEHPLYMNTPTSRLDAIVGIPLKIGSNVVGVMNISYNKPRKLNAAELQALNLLGTQASIAIENARLYQEVQRGREVAETLRDIGLVLNSQLDQQGVLEKILEQISRVLPYDAASIWLDDGDGFFRVYAMVGYERFGVENKLPTLAYPIETTPTTSLMQRTRQTLIIPDVQIDDLWTGYEGDTWIRSWASAPIIVRGDMIGQLNLDHTQTNFYHHEHASILTALGTQISIAVGNARLFEAERLRRMEMEAVQRSTLSLTSSLDLREVLDSIISATLELVKAQIVYVFLYQDDTLTFGAAMHATTGMTVEPYVPPRPEGLTYTVARTGKMIIVPNINEHPLFAHADPGWNQHIGSMLSIPLKIGMRVVGVMNIAYSDERTFKEDAELRALHLLANQASIAIENARLFTHVQDHAVIMEDEVKKRTAELERERAQLQAILDAMGEGVIYDEKLHIKYVNHALIEMTGYDVHEWHDYMHLMKLSAGTTSDYLDLWNTINQNIERLGIWRGEMQVQRKDGSTFAGSLICTTVRDAEGQIAGVVTILRDISQEKALQAQKDRFIANASHELRTPLANFKTRLYLLKKRPEKLEQHLGVLDTVTDQMSDLVQDLLDVSRFERGVIKLQREKVALQEIVTQVVDTQRPDAEQKSIMLRTDLPPQPVYTYLDQMRFQQVMTNLVVNAINYTHEGGYITVQLLQQETHVVIRVQDTGVGIAEDLLPQVFQPFFRAGDGLTTGTGLGLTISKEITELHGGAITVESHLGSGSTFTVRLPIITEL